ncbi:MAG: TlpA family protein disulfide reductase [Kofleriaceae bacterium]|nr:TlpA family protein disulfide reductase [Kofleriaceae bacterium]
MQPRLAALSVVPLLAGLIAGCAPLPPPDGPDAARPPATAPTAAAPITDPHDAYPMLITARDLDGQPLGDAGGRATVAVVFASWCVHCRHEMEVLGTLLDARADLRVVGVNYREHEEYDDRGDSDAVRAFVRDRAPWLRVVPADDALFRALGAPPKVPTVYVYDGRGALVAMYDRRDRPAPEAAELGALLDRLAR